MIEWIFATFWSEALFAAGGLIVGWNFLPQPKWVRSLVERIEKGTDNLRG